MRKCVFICVVCLFVYVQSAPASLETVWLKDMTTRVTTDKRTFSDLDLPDELTFNLRRGSADLTLNLKRNHDINPNADIYFARKTKDDRSVLAKTPNLEKKDVAYYQDMENGAFMTVRCVKRSNGQCDRDINGNIQIGGSIYDLRPAEIDVTSRNLLEVPSLHGKRYVLQDQAYIQRENPVENKDAGNVNEKNEEQELIALFRRFQEQHKQNHFPRSGDTSRKLKNVYHVKVAVLIDSVTWDLYMSMVSYVSPITRNRKVIRNIRESYSHVMNGANLLYRGIQDLSIEIHIILSKFIYFKRKEDFKRWKSKVVAVNRQYYIDVNDYLHDLRSWDNFMGKTYTPSYDHAMLFTRYNLYDGLLNESLLGLTYHEEVCNIGSRVSIVQSTGYFLTSFSAAHELGHNLGANHDGEYDAISCKAEDLFIMTPEEPEIHPYRPLSRNLWIFSYCSVEAFKRILKDKDCVTHPGSFYDKQEYKEHVMEQPGEVYTPDDQCHDINGPKSVYCGIRGLQYVGETEKVHERINIHRSDWMTKKLDASPVANHFSLQAKFSVIQY